MRIEHNRIWATWRSHRYLVENWVHVLIRYMFCSSFFHAHFDFYYFFFHIIHFLFLSETLNLNVIFSMNLSFNWYVITVNLFYLDKTKVVTGNMFATLVQFLIFRLEPLSKISFFNSYSCILQYITVSGGLSPDSAFPNIAIYRVSDVSLILNSILTFECILTNTCVLFQFYDYSDMHHHVYLIYMFCYFSLNTLILLMLFHQFLINTFLSILFWKHFYFFNYNMFWIIIFV
jgi:hypothetical protein